MHQFIGQSVFSTATSTLQRVGLFTLLLLALLGAPTISLAAEDPLLQGLTLTISAGGKSDSRIARLVALGVPAGQPSSPFLPTGPFTAKWVGSIHSDLRAEFAFAFESTGSVKVTINQSVILEGSNSAKSPTIKLQKGANQLLVEFTSPPKGESLLRLFWSSKEFPWEPIPPTVLHRSPPTPELLSATALRSGRLLFAESNCVACHEAANFLPPKGEGLPELSQGAPAFGELGAKFHQPWLAAWINHPQSIRPHSLMPKVFASPPGKIDQRSADLAAYFMTLGAKSPPLIPDPSLVAPGGALFANLGCIACHTKPDIDFPTASKDEHARVPLGHLSAKWQVPALTAYLKDPAQNFASTRMPHFRLTDAEATQLTAYLITSSKDIFPEGPKGDPTRGAQLLVSSGCLNCHAGLPPTTTPTLANTLKTGWTKGCLAPDPATRGTAPDFGFTPAQLASLRALAHHGFDSLKQDPPNEFAERQIVAQRCTACHSRDGQSSVWSQLESEIAPLQAASPHEEGEGHPIVTTALPALTWLGEKLHPAAMAELIAGQTKDRPRPWLFARMPGYPRPTADRLATGLTYDHGLSLTDPPPTAPAPPAPLTIGEKLLTENGGFNCLQCHGLGDRPATAVFEAPGPNLALTHQRIRRAYFDRWLLFPGRIDPDTKMPRFADDAGKTPLTDFFDGHAHSQFEAIWLYLQSLKK